MPAPPGHHYATTYTIDFPLTADSGPIDLADFRHRFLQAIGLSGSNLQIEITVADGQGSPDLTSRLRQLLAVYSPSELSSLLGISIHSDGATFSSPVRQLVQTSPSPPPAPPALPPPALPPLAPGFILLDSIVELRAHLSAATSGSHVMIFVPPRETLELDGSELEIAAGVRVTIASTAEGATFDGDRRSRIFDVFGTLHLQHLTLSRGGNEYVGGGLFLHPGASAALDHVVISNCTAAAYDTTHVGNARGGAAYVSASAELVLRHSNVSLCTASNTRDGNQAQGGAMYIAGSVTLDHTLITACAASHSTHAADGQGGGLFIAGGTVLLTNRTLLLSNVASGPGSTMSAIGGATTYQLPTPPGRFIAALECLVYRSACEVDAKGNIVHPACEQTVQPCSLLVGNDATYSGTTCRPQLVNQPCDWVSTPSLIGSMVQALPLEALEGDYPAACPAGLLGSADLAYQASARCAGQCPAGWRCPMDATVEPLVCEPGHACPAGSAMALPCRSGTYSNATGLVSLDECRECPLGHQCIVGATEPTPCAPGTSAEAPSQGECAKCVPGKYQPLSGSTSCLRCPVGSHCSEGASSHLLCDSGSYRSAEGARSQADCTPCPAGSACSTGAISPTPCDPGTIAASSRTSICTPCPAGKFQSGAGATACIDSPVGTYCLERATAPTACSPGSYTAIARQSDCALCIAGKYQKALGQTACDDCPAGSVCPVSAYALTQCAAGSYRNATGGESQANCTACPAGHACPAGAVSPTICTPGTIAQSTGQYECAACQAGSYQDQPGSTSCLPCPRQGVYCSEGSPAPLPCPAGTAMNESLPTMTSVDSCINCGIGTFCPVGATAPIKCAPGTINPLTRQDKCAVCNPGSYQGQEGHAMCHECPRGAYCPERSIAPRYCPGGTFNNRTGRPSLLDCFFVPAGTWSPAGSELPLDCPPSGFLCPGYYADHVNDPPGSLPIQLATGGVSSEQVVVRQATELSVAMTLATEIGMVDEAMLLEQLARVYRVPQSELKLLSLDGGSVVVTISFTARTAEQATAFTRSVYSTSDAVLSQVLGMNATRNGAVQLGLVNLTVVEVVEEDCEMGFWCSAGQRYSCEPGTYNPLPNQHIQSACLFCPGGKFNPSNASTSIASCTDCPPGKANALPGAASSESCVPCSMGSFASESGSEACQPCPHGAYSSTSGAVQCENCRPGSYCSAVGPTACSIDTYNPNALAHLSSNCTACPRRTSTLGKQGSRSIHDCLPSDLLSYAQSPKPRALLMARACLGLPKHVMAIWLLKYLSWRDGLTAWADNSEVAVCRTQGRTTSRTQTVASRWKPAPERAARAQ